MLPRRLHICMLLSQVSDIVPDITALDMTSFTIDPSEGPQNVLSVMTNFGCSMVYCSMVVGLFLFSIFIELKVTIKN